MVLFVLISSLICRKGTLVFPLGGFTSKIVSPRAGDRRCGRHQTRTHLRWITHLQLQLVGFFFFLPRKHRGFTAAWKRLTRARCKHFHAPSDVEATPAQAAAAAAAQPHPLWLLRVTAVAFGCESSWGLDTGSGSRCGGTGRLGDADLWIESVVNVVVGTHRAVWPGWAGRARLLCRLW